MPASPPPSFQDHVLEAQVQRIVAGGKLKEVLESWLRFLIRAHLDGEFTGSGKETLIKIEEKRCGRKVPSPEIKNAYDTARQNIRRLARHLKDYYQTLSESAPDRILILIPSDDDKREKHGNERRYEPQIDRSFLPSANPFSLNSNFRPIGNNVVALDYVTRQVSQLSRIEETFTRWANPQESLYQENKPFDSFLTELKNSKLLYRAVLGPFVDPVVFKSHGLHDVLAQRPWHHKKPGAKFFRLLHAAPIMSFTLLYYSKNPTSETETFYEETDEIEVLFGFGVYESRGKADETAVFSSKHPRLYREFKHQFDTLRHADFSYEIAVGRPHLFSNVPPTSDVIASFENFPDPEIIRHIEACGREFVSDEKKEDATADYSTKDSYPHGTRQPHITICVSALKELNDKPFKRALKAALRRPNVQVSIALWDPEAPFLKLRQEVILDEDDADPLAVRQETTDNHRLVDNLLNSHKNFKAYTCHGPLASVSIFWIDDLIYFSPYWIAENVSEGPHFLVAACSTTGIALQEQYREMIKTSELRARLPKA